MTEKRRRLFGGCVRLCQRPSRDRVLAQEDDTLVSFRVIDEFTEQEHARWRAGNSYHWVLIDIIRRRWTASAYN